MHIRIFLFMRFDVSFCLLQVGEIDDRRVTIRILIPGWLTVNLFFVFTVPLELARNSFWRQTDKHVLSIYSYL
jgi:hypothetical protein